MKLLLQSVPFMSHFLPRLTVHSYTSSSLFRSPLLIYTSCSPSAPSTPVSTASTLSFILFLPLSFLYTDFLSIPSSLHTHFILHHSAFKACPSLISYCHDSPSLSPPFSHMLPHPHICFLWSTLHPQTRYHITSPGMIFTSSLNRDQYTPVLPNPEFSLPKCPKLGNWGLPFHQ